MAENSSMPDKANSTTKSTFLYFEKCTPLDDVTPWCYTRVDENLTYILGNLDLKFVVTIFNF